MSVTNHPLFSVVMPVYNVCKIEAKFRRCVESVLAQSWRNWELIMVNDASSDATDDILQSMADSDARIRVLTNKENIRQGMSRNLGTDAAAGNYIVYCDHDDFMRPWALQIAARFAESHDNPDVIQLNHECVANAVAEEFISSLVRTRAWCKRDFVVRKGDEILNRFLYGRLSLMSWARAIRVDLARRIKFVDAYPEDIPHSLELWAQARTVVEVRELCYVYIVKEQSAAAYRRVFFESIGTWHSIINKWLLDRKIAERMPGGHRIFCIQWAKFFIFLLSRFDHGEEEILAWGQMVDGMKINLLGAAMHCLWRDLKRWRLRAGIKDLSKTIRYYQTYKHLRNSVSSKASD